MPTLNLDANELLDRLIADVTVSKDHTRRAKAALMVLGAALVTEHPYVSEMVPHVRKLIDDAMNRGAAGALMRMMMPVTFPKDDHEP